MPEREYRTNKQIARSFLQSVDDLVFDAWRTKAAPNLVASANGGDVMNLQEFEGMCARHADIVTVAGPTSGALTNGGCSSSGRGRSCRSAPTAW